MKFAKLLQRTTELGDSSWNEFWIDYKGLKKLLGEIQERPSARSEVVSEEDVAAVLAKSPTEIGFFTKLRAELTKVSAFFLSQEARMASRYQDVMVEADRIKKSKVAVPKDETVSLVRRAVEFYMQLIMLENYAVMNYCGFGKILKKHDKRTGFLTKRKFMRRMVDPQEFAHYPRLLRMLTQTETTYKRLVSVLPADTRRGLAQASTGGRFRELASVKAAGTLEKRAHSEADLAGLAKGQSKAGASTAAAGGGGDEANDTVSEPPAKRAAVEGADGRAVGRGRRARTSKGKAVGATAGASDGAAAGVGGGGRGGAFAGRKRGRGAAGAGAGAEATAMASGADRGTASSTASEASSAPAPPSTSVPVSDRPTTATTRAAVPSPVLSSRSGTAADAQLAAEALLGVGMIQGTSQGVSQGAMNGYAAQQQPFAAHIGVMAVPVATGGMMVPMVGYQYQQHMQGPVAVTAAPATAPSSSQMMDARRRWMLQQQLLQQQPAGGPATGGGTPAVASASSSSSRGRRRG